MKITVKEYELALREENAGLINAIKKMRSEKEKLQADLKEARQQIRELNERIVELEDIDYLTSEGDTPITRRRITNGRN